MWLKLDNYADFQLGTEQPLNMFFYGYFPFFCALLIAVWDWEGI